MHRDIHDGACFMEAASFVAGEPWSDRPQCVGENLGSLLRFWNDSLADEARDSLLRPLIPAVLNTRGSITLDMRRAALAAHWAAARHASSWLGLAARHGADPVLGWASHDLRTQLPFGIDQPPPPSVLVADWVRMTEIRFDRPTWTIADFGTAIGGCITASASCGTYWSDFTMNCHRLAAIAMTWVDPERCRSQIEEVRSDLNLSAVDLVLRMAALTDGAR